jgi:hypothetical protein
MVKNNNKLIGMLLMVVLMCGFAFLIKKSRSTRERLAFEKVERENRERHKMDSLNQVEAKERELALWNSYVNRSICNSSETDVSVCILADNGSVSPVSSSIASIYKQKGFNGNIGLLNTNFFGTEGFRELSQGNSEIISRLGLKNSVDFIVVGHINYESTTGSSPIVCHATLNANVISVIEGHLIKTISYSEAGNGVSLIQAEEYTTERLLRTYFLYYSSL